MRPVPAPATPPAALAIRDYRVNYTINGMRAAWTVGARSKEHARLTIQELVPGCKVNLVSLQGDW